MMARHSTEEQEVFDSAFDTRVGSSQVHHQESHTGPILHVIDDIPTGAASPALVQQLTQSLFFPGIAESAATIPRAHAQTFQWIFNQGSGFREWLRSGTGIFWIAGKPGSGKSTLVKFIAENPKTTNLLTEWAGGHNFVNLSYFIKAERNRSQLLRSLLWQILQGNSSMSATLIDAFRERQWLRECEGSNNMPINWKFADLELLLLRTIRHAQDGTRLCLFIDGLDRFEGDHVEILTLIRKIASSKSIKICVSSRPWNNFEDAFGLSSPTFRLQDFTYDDIKNYVQDKLSSDPGVMRIFEAKPQELAEFREQITRKAAGMFLWVALTLKDLSQTAGHAETVRDLRRRLDDTPVDLYDLFDTMVNRVPLSYRQQAVTFLRLSLACQEPLPAMLYWFAGENHHVEEVYLGTSSIDWEVPRLHEPIQRDNMAALLAAAQRRIEASCGGMLEVVPTRAWSENPYVSMRVSFIHTTSKEFVENWLARSSRAGRSQTRKELICLLLKFAKHLPHLQDVEHRIAVVAVLGEAFHHFVSGEISLFEEETASRLLLEIISAARDALRLPGLSQSSLSLITDTISGLVAHESVILSNPEMVHEMEQILEETANRTTDTVNNQLSETNVAPWSLILPGVDSGELAWEMIGSEETWSSIVQSLRRDSIDTSDWHDETSSMAERSTLGESVFNRDDRTMTSNTSMSEIQTPRDTLVETILGDAELHPLLVGVFSHPKPRTEELLSRFQGLMDKYSKELLAVAENPLQEEAAKFVHDNLDYLSLAVQVRFGSSSSFVMDGPLRRLALARCNQRGLTEEHVKMFVLRQAMSENSTMEGEVEVWRDNGEMAIPEPQVDDEAISKALDGIRRFLGTGAPITRLRRRLRLLGKNSLEAAKGDELQLPRIE